MEFLREKLLMQKLLTNGVLVSLVNVGRASPLFFQKSLNSILNTLLTAHMLVILQVASHIKLSQHV